MAILQQQEEKIRMVLSESDASVFNLLSLHSLQHKKGKRKLSFWLSYELLCPSTNLFKIPKRRAVAEWSKALL